MSFSIKSYFWLLGITVGLASASVWAQSRDLSTRGNPIPRATHYESSLRRMIINYPSVEAYFYKVNAAQKRARAAWLGYAPSLSVSFNHNDGSYKSMLFPTAYPLEQDSLQIGLTLPLFDGGATLFAAKAAEDQAALISLQSEVNVNDLSVQLTQAYTGMILAKNQVLFLENIVGALKKFCSYPSIPKDYREEFVEQLMSETNLYEARLVPARHALEQQELLYEKMTVEVIASDYQQLDTLEAINKFIEIEPNANRAIQRVTQSLRYQMAVENVEMAIHTKNGALARAISPKANLTFVHSQDQMNLKGLEPINTGMDGINFRLSFDLNPSSGPAVQAAAEEVEAAKMERVKIFRDIEYDLRSAYIKLSGLNENLEKIYSNLIRLEDEMLRIQKKIQNKEMIDLRAGLATVRQLEEAWLAYANTLSGLILAKAQIAGTTGFFSQYESSKSNHR